MTTLAAPRKTFTFANMASGGSVSRADFVFPSPVTRDWAWGDATGEGVRVCVIDSGVTVGRPEVGPIEGAYTVTTQDDGDEVRHVVPDDLGDVNGHGTACAAIIRRLAPGVRLTSVRILGPSLGGGGMPLVCSLQWAIAQRFDVVNLSLSTSRLAYKRQLHDLADKAFFNGMIIVASAHNRPVESFPWMFPSVISVGSHNSADPERLEVNTRPPVEFFAAGVQVVVPQPDGHTTRVSGNSFATPHITGLAARIRGRHPTFRASQIKYVLSALASNLE